MSGLADKVILSLRHHHDRLTEVVDGLTKDQLVVPSGASEWRVCDVLSHLGSGSELMRQPLVAAVAGVAAPEADNNAVWDRWNVMAPHEQAQEFVHHGMLLLETLESLTPEQRDTVTIRRPRLLNPSRSRSPPACVSTRSSSTRGTLPSASTPPRRSTPPLPT